MEYNSHFKRTARTKHEAEEGCLKATSLTNLQETRHTSVIHSQQECQCVPQTVKTVIIIILCIDIAINAWRTSHDEC